MMNTKEKEKEEGDESGCVLPEDIVFNILLWLPVVSLLRFKSVCKSWYAHIQASTFISQHYLHHKNINNNLVMLHIRTCDHPYKEDDIDHETLPHDNHFFLLEFDEVSLALDLPPPPLPEDENDFFPPTHQLQVVASCNGIICLCNQILDSTFVALWNPAMKQLRALPQTPLFRPSGRILYVTFGFGFDIKARDYKVVRIIDIYLEDRQQKHQVEIYSLATDSWRILHEAVVHPYLSRNFVTPPHQNGIFCWLRSEPATPQALHFFITTFDLNNEVFGTMPFPDVICHTPSGKMLFSLCENIACVNILADDGSRRDIFEVWVLYEFGVKESWTKLYTIGPFPWNFDAKLPPRVHGILMNAEFVLVRRNRQLLLFNPVTLEERTLQIQNYMYQVCDLNVFHYNESLVSIEGGNGEANTTNSAV